MVKKIRGVFTVSDAGGVAKGDAVKVNGANTVARCTAATDKPIGVAAFTAANGAAVDVITGDGIVTLTASAAVAAGDVLGPSATAGRVAPLNSYTPTGTNGAPAVTTDANVIKATGTVANAGHVPDAASAVSNAAHVAEASVAWALGTCGSIGCDGDSAQTTGALTDLTDVLRAPTVTDRTDVLRASDASKVAVVTSVPAASFTGTAAGRGSVLGRALEAAAGDGSTFKAYINAGGGM